MRLALLALMAAGAFAQTPSSSGDASPLDYEFFKTKVQPIFLAKRPGHARCYVCHSTGTPFRLQRLSPGATSWDDEQSRKNFRASSAMVNTSEPEQSLLLREPLAESAGGNHFHPGGKHWESKDAPEWKILDEWAHGQKLSAASK
ncbi:MAG TPA: hypothetical protein VKX49_01770 [Bryobacteraceae bacterium]|nr:hypothetical protein [Bryobacteraceae bacterium]